MINLFDTFNDSTRLLYRTLKQVGIDNPTVVIEDDGFLPDDISSPLQFFSCITEKDSDKPLYYNEVCVPEFWEISGDNNEAWIKDMGKIRGRIQYKKNYHHRIVKCIEWMDDCAKVRAVDCYNKLGILFKTQVYDDNQKLILSTYFNREGQTIIYENHITHHYMLNYKDKVYCFENKTQFIVFYLKQAFNKLDSFFINSLSYPFLAIYQLGTQGNDYLFWQEKSNEIPGNMRVMLNSKKRNFTVLIPDEEEYSHMKQQIPNENRIKKSGYVYNFLKPITHQKEILIVTNSDRLEHIDIIVNELSDHSINIAAVTEMSQKLMSLRQYKNVNLYPKVGRQTLINLYKQSSIYLDINYGNEILQSVKGAFDYNLLILGFEPLAHNKTYTFPKHLVASNDKQHLIQLIKSANETQIYHNMLNAQKEHANIISKKQFLQGFYK